MNNTTIGIIGIIGGDLRIVNLVKILANENYKVYTYALEKTDIFNTNKNIVKCEYIKELTDECNIILGPIPLSKNNIEVNTPFSDRKVKIEDIIKNIDNKIFIAGSINQQIKDLVQNKAIKVIDLLDREELTVLNAISTAEGAIQIVMEETQKTIHNSNILILGFGRIGKILAKMLTGIGANIYCMARKEKDLAWIKSYNYNPINLANINDSLNKYDIIINTIPFLILDKEKIKLLKKDCLLIDLASSPGGIDIEYANQEKIKAIWALALPGKVAPITSAQYIKQTLYNIFKEI